MLCLLSITKHGSTWYIGMAHVPRHRFHTFEKSHFLFYFQQNLPLSPPPSSHCRYARLPEVWLNLHKYPLRYNQKFIIAILHLLLLLLVVVVVVFSFNKRNSKTVRGIRLKLCTMIIMLWRYTKQGGFLFHPHDKCTAQQERGECTTVSNLRTAWTLLGSELSFTCTRGAQEVHKRFVKLSSVSKNSVQLLCTPLFLALLPVEHVFTLWGPQRSILFRTFGELQLL